MSSVLTNGQLEDLQEQVDRLQEQVAFEHGWVGVWIERAAQHEGASEYWQALALAYWEEMKLLRAEVERLQQVFACQADEHRWYEHEHYGQVCMDCSVVRDTLQPEDMPELASWSVRREYSYARGWEGRGVLDAAWTAWTRWLG